MTAPFHLNFTRWNGELKLRQKYALRRLTRKWRNKEYIISLTITNVKFTTLVTNVISNEKGTSRYALFRSTNHLRYSSVSKFY